MKCANNNCSNSAITTTPFLDTDGVILKIPVCKDCKKLPCFSDSKEKT